MHNSKTDMTVALKRIKAMWSGNNRISENESSSDVLGRYGTYSW